MGCGALTAGPGKGACAFSPGNGAWGIRGRAGRPVGGRLTGASAQELRSPRRAWLRWSHEGPLAASLPEFGSWDGYRATGALRLWLGFGLGPVGSARLGRTAEVRAARPAAFGCASRALWGRRCRWQLRGRRQRGVLAVGIYETSTLAWAPSGLRAVLLADVARLHAIVGGEIHTALDGRAVGTGTCRDDVARVRGAGDSELGGNHALCTPLGLLTG